MNYLIRFTLYLPSVFTSIQLPFYNEYRNYTDFFGKIYKLEDELSKSYDNFVQSLDYSRSHSSNLFDVEMNSLADTNIPVNYVLKNQSIHPTKPAQRENMSLNHSQLLYQRLTIVEIMVLCYLHEIKVNAVVVFHFPQEGLYQVNMF